MDHLPIMIPPALSKFLGFTFAFVSILAVVALPSFVLGVPMTLPPMSVQAPTSTSFPIIVASAPFENGAPSGLPDTGRVAAFDGSGNQVWEHWGTVPYHYIGWSLAVGGLVNGDSFPEVIAGAPYFPQTQGRVDLLSGADGNSLCSASAPPSLSNSFFGMSVSGPANLDGDNVPDYVVGAPLADITTSSSNEGRVYGISGSNCAINFTQTGVGNNDHFGLNVLATPTTELDGNWSRSDFFVGAVLFNPPYTRIGTLFGMGSSVSTPLWSRDGDIGGRYYTRSLAQLPDVDGDGIVDLVSGGPGGYYLGSSNLPSAGYVNVVSGSTGTTLAHLVGENLSDEFGMSVAFLGDNDQDGNVEFAVGAPGYSSPTHAFAGKVYVYELTNASTATLLWSRVGDSNGDFFGFSLAGVKDADGDGQNELVVGAPYFDGAAGTNTGKIYDFHAWSGTLDWSREGPTSGGGPAQGYRFGYAVSGTPII